MPVMRYMPVAAAMLLALGCSKPDGAAPDAAAAPTVEVAKPPAVEVVPERMALYGDLHVHTQLSFDAYIFGTRSTPATAYAYAKGEPLQHPSGFTMQLKKPLDFEAVTDHDMYMGIVRAMDDPSTKPGQTELGRKIQAATTPQSRLATFQEVVAFLRGSGGTPPDFVDTSVIRAAWDEVIAAAQNNYEPGKFTTFVGYEFTASGNNRENLHRNVIFRDTPAELPFAVTDSPNPEDLWDWLDAQRAEGHEALAIPHNSNGSDGLMFDLRQADGTPFNAAYAEQRARNEPLVEISQVKGTSETHPLLSPNDEWADFELMQVKIATDQFSKAPGSYVREALRNGLVLAATEGFNPFRFGFVAASDTHVGAGAFSEDNYWSKVGFVDGTAQQRGSVPLAEPDASGNRYATGNSFETWGAAGLAAVWAESNTREAIYDAFRRKETFGTSGPRLKVRLFGGYGLDGIAAGDVTALYARGVPMGGDLLADGDKVPVFHAQAMRDPDSAPLQRLQIVKGWVADGEGHEQVFDVACADGLSVDPATQRCPDNGASVDITSCAFSQDKGAAELSAVWRDPDFDHTQHAFYYVRVLENPTCRWSTWDAVRAGVAPREDLKTTIQERAWSSPIWFAPAKPAVAGA
ncbi:MAG: DUF3604 domain-containing protein [Pseudomonadales bacterium]|nr:DUF3604 domain-containing protein [Pseudomonadales bacterium]MCP5185836.1 DUF3604 domain-containing protein [Pseudomonadales bacterium]